MGERSPEDIQKWGLGTEQSNPESSHYPLISSTQEALLVDGWTIVSDHVTEYGFDPGFRPHVLSTYFGENGILQPETYDVFPPDRMRARGVVAFEFAVDGRGISLRDHTDDTITGKDYHEDERRYPITPLMHDTYFRHHLTKLLSLLPRPMASGSEGPWAAHRDAISYADRLLSSASHGWKEPEDLIQEYIWRQRAGCRGIIGVNFFEVFHDVVSGFHHDGVDWVIVDRLNRHGGGTVSELHALGAPKNLTTMQRALAPGQKFIFNDHLRAHKTDPLVPPSNGGQAFMQTLVITVDFEKPLTLDELEKQVLLAGEPAASGLLTTI